MYALDGNFYCNYYAMSDNWDEEQWGCFETRAVVSLNSGVKLTSDGTNSWTISK